MALASSSSPLPTLTHVTAYIYFLELMLRHSSVFSESMSQEAGGSERAEQVLSRSNFSLFAVV